MRLNDLIDESDPDSTMPNIVHAFQTAERIRHSHPDRDWFHLTGLIHDLGKVIIPTLLLIYYSIFACNNKSQFFGRQVMAFYEPQWAVVGDTFPLGVAFAPSIVYRNDSFDLNPDLNDSRYKYLGQLNSLI